MSLDAYGREYPPADRYLNFAGIGPMSHRAIARMTEVAEAVSITHEKPTEAFLAQRDGAIRVGAAFLGTDAAHVTFASSTSHGLFTVAFGLRGGNVVIPANEFPANRYPWLRAADALGGEVRLVPVPDGRVTADLLAPHIDRETRAVAMSAIGYATGYRADLAAVRSVCGDALLVVDSVQASGAWHVGLDHADVVVAGSQKWMRAGLGAALVGFSDRALDRIDITLGGWTGVEDMFGPAPPPHPSLPGAARFSMGSLPLLAMGAMRGSMEVTLAAGTDVIERAMVERVGAFEEALLAAGARLLTPDYAPQERSTIFTFSMPGISTDALQAALAAEGFVVEERDGLTRVSPHATTPLDTADELRRALGSLR